MWLVRLFRNVSVSKLFKLNCRLVPVSHSEHYPVSGRVTICQPRLGVSVSPVCTTCSVRKNYLTILSKFFAPSRSWYFTASMFKRRCHLPTHLPKLSSRNYRFTCLLWSWNCHLSYSFFKEKSDPQSNFYSIEDALVENVTLKVILTCNIMAAKSRIDAEKEIV